MNSLRRAIALALFTLAAVFSGPAVAIGEPAPPAGLTAVADVGFVDLAWQPVDGVISGYRVYRAMYDGTTGGLIGETSADVTSWHDDRVAAGYTYWYHVRAF